MAHLSVSHQNLYASKLTSGSRNSGDKTLWVSFTFVFTFKAQQ